MTQSEAIAAWLASSHGQAVLSELEFDPQTATALAGCPECKMLPGTLCEMRGLDDLIGMFCHRQRIWQAEQAAVLAVAREKGLPQGLVGLRVA